MYRSCNDEAYPISTYKMNPQTLPIHVYVCFSTLGTLKLDGLWFHNSFDPNNSSEIRHFGAGGATTAVETWDSCGAHCVDLFGWSLGRWSFVAKHGVRMWATWEGSFCHAAMVFGWSNHFERSISNNLQAEPRPPALCPTCRWKPSKPLGGSYHSISLHLPAVFLNSTLGSVKKILIAISEAGVFHTIHLRVVLGFTTLPYLTCSVRRSSMATSVGTVGPGSQIKVLIRLSEAVLAWKRVWQLTCQDWLTVQLLKRHEVVSLVWISTPWNYEIQTLAVDGRNPKSRVISPCYAVQPTNCNVSTGHLQIFYEKRVVAVSKALAWLGCPVAGTVGAWPVSRESLQSQSLLPFLPPLRTCQDRWNHDSLRASWFFVASLLIIIHHYSCGTHDYLHWICSHFSSKSNSPKLLWAKITSTHSITIWWFQDLWLLNVSEVWTHVWTEDSQQLSSNFHRLVKELHPQDLVPRDVSSHRLAVCCGGRHCVWYPVCASYLIWADGMWASSGL